MNLLECCGNVSEGFVCALCQVGTQVEVTSEEVSVMSASALRFNAIQMNHHARFWGESLLFRSQPYASSGKEWTCCRRFEGGVELDGDIG